MSLSDTNTQQTIKPRGTIQNMLNQGFSDVACISENIDDSLGAGAKQIRIVFDTKTKRVVHIDTGVGMTKEQCFESHCLNSRKDKSKNRQGRFGIGRKQSQAVMNNLESSTKTLTKARASLPKEDVSEGVIELDINWKESIDKDMYQITPHDITAKSVSLWKQYAIEPSNTGTITVIPCSNKIFDGLLTKLTTKVVEENLLFQTGRTYHKYIQEGVTITFVLDGQEIPVTAVNPYLPTYQGNDVRMTYPLAVFQCENSIRVYYKDEGEDVYRDFSSSSAGKKMAGPIPKNWSFLGRLNFTGIYVKQEDVVPAFSLNKSRYTIPNDDEKGIQKLREALLGTYYCRNGKVISRFNIASKKAGDTAHYKYYEDIIQIIDFDSDLDDHFDINVNKSKIDETNVTSEIRLTIRALSSDFSRKMYTQDCKCVKCAKPSSPSTPAVNQTPVVPPPAAKSTSVIPPAPVVTQAPAAKQTPIVSPAPSSPPAVKPTPQAATYTVVEPHVREQSKSAKDIVGLAMNFAEKILNSPNIEEVYNRTSNQSQKGYVKYWSTLHEVQELLEELGVTLEEA